MRPSLFIILIHLFIYYSILKKGIYNWFYQ